MRLIGYLQELYQNARSEKHKTHSHCFTCCFLGVKRRVSSYWNYGRPRIFGTGRWRCNRQERKLCTAILCCMPPTYRSALGPFHATASKAAIIAFLICREWVCPCVCGFMGYSSYTMLQFVYQVTVRIPCYSSYTRLQFLYHVTVRIPGCSSYTRLQFVYQAAVRIPGCSSYTRLQFVYQATVRIPGYSSYTRLQFVYQATVRIPGYSSYTRLQFVYQATVRIPGFNALY